jgi:hypothetical protein
MTTTNSIRSAIALHGERSGQVYRLGDSLRVRVARVDLDERKIDFEPIESGRRDAKERCADLRGVVAGARSEYSG